MPIIFAGGERGGIHIGGSPLDLRWNRPGNLGGKIRVFRLCFGPKEKMVGATGFEPVTTRTPSVCATRLRYAPTGDLLKIF